jgi:hypothetical protein
MSDMLENGASGGAEPVPPSESHDEFLELCATATTGSLSSAERRRLKEHLSKCESCREIMAQYQAIVDRVMPVLASDADEENAAPTGWSPEQAETQLFARVSESTRFTNQREPGQVSAWPEAAAPRKVPAPHPDALWRHLWGQFAAAILLVAALGLIAYRIGVRRGTDLAPRAVIPASSKPPLADSGGPEASASDRSSAPNAKGIDPKVAALRFQLGERAAEIERLKAQQAQTERETTVEEADRHKLAQDKAALSQQLETAQVSLESLQQKLDSATSQNSDDTARVAALQQKIDQLTESLRGHDQEIARERELLDHDRDIRDLMGSRDLYIAEVYDVAKTGDTQKPFGRVFYTSGKSLIFYAYDLDQQPGIERASTFQAWGRRGSDRDLAVNLGILYQDNANKKRWVLKSDNPRTLAQIDAVFVTVEPNGGSPHPSGKPLLFAYLRIQPNHP